MTATEDVADEVASKLAGMDPKARAAAKAKAKVGVGGGVGSHWGVPQQQQPETPFCLKEQAAGVLMAPCFPLRQVDRRPSVAAAAVVPHPLICHVGWCVVLCAVLCCAVLHPQADMAEGMWVTDEFESEVYEMGNMEAAWGMYLWDK